MVPLARMSNVLSDSEKNLVLELGRRQWSLRRIERETGVRRETVAGYLRAAGIPIRPARRWGHWPNPAKEVSTEPASPSPPAIGPEAPSNPAKEVSTDFPAGSAPTRSPQASACEAYREFIEESLGKGRNAMAIWQDLVGDHSFQAQYASVRRFVLTLRGKSAPEAHPFIITAPGEEAQVDYGEGPMVRDPATGKYRRTRMFVLTLGYSRKSVRLLVWKSGTREWCALHELAFQRLGGVASVVVLDNLREGVLKPDIYDPALNPLFRDVLKHYGAVALPCRVRNPDRKGKVESAVGHAQSTPLKGRRFESLEAAQAYLDHWEERWADTRIHGTTKRQVAVMFAQEKPALLPLPVEPFRYYQFGKRTVHLNGCVEVAGGYYGPPPGNIGRELDVQWDERRVRILDPKTGQLLREHDRVPPGHVRVRAEDRPKHTPPTTQKLLNRADSCGKSIGAVCKRIHEVEGELGVKRMQGVLGLVKRHGVGVVERACALALEVGVPSYRFVKQYVDRQPDLPLSLKQVDPMIRQLTLYRDLIDRKTKEISDEHD